MEHQYSKMVLGSTEEEGEEKLWDKWQGMEFPPIFGFLALAKDGGFSEVKDLYYPSRWISSALLMVFIIYNVYTIVQLDYFMMCDDHDAVEHIIGEGLSEIEDRFYLSKPLITWLYSNLGIDYDPDPTEVLGFFELCWLGFHFVNALYCSVMVYFDNGGFRRWYHVQFIFWEILPGLSTYSAMKLLNAIVPSVFLYNLFEKIGFIREAIAEKKAGQDVKAILKFVWWLASVALGFLIGFDTFLMKLRLVSGHADMQIHGFWSVLKKIVLPVLQFLVQALGVVQLGPFVRKRLFIFIFGGEDGIMQDEEVEVMQTWNALLARRMWRDLTSFEFIAVMTSFSDEDFQSLVFNEKKEWKQREIGT